MKKVVIIGVGLMGGSLGMALRKAKSRSKKCYSVLGIGRNIKSLRLAKKKGAVDDYSTDIKDIAGADIVVICCPVDMIVQTYKLTAQYVSKKTVITDIGSVKLSIDSQIQKLIKKNNNYPCFVGCHPMAGNEKNGIKFADENLYAKSYVVITSLKKDAKTMIVSKMWRDVKSSIIYMTAEEHDKIVAFTSHLPHIIAFNFYNLFLAKNKRNNKIRNITAGSFSSLTRVAESSPNIWLPIFLNNKKNLRILADEFCAQMKFFVKQFDNEKSLKKMLSKSVKNENQ